MLIRFDVDYPKALCLAWALGSLRAKCRELERPFPFAEQLRAAELVLQGGQKGTPDEADVDTGRDERKLIYTQREAGEILDKCEKTIQLREQRRARESVAHEDTLLRVESEIAQRSA